MTPIAFRDADRANHRAMPGRQHLRRDDRMPADADAADTGLIQTRDPGEQAFDRGELRITRSRPRSRIKGRGAKSAHDIARLRAPNMGETSREYGAAAEDIARSIGPRGTTRGRSEDRRGACTEIGTPTINSKAKENAPVILGAPKGSG